MRLSSSCARATITSGFGALANFRQLERMDLWTVAPAVIEEMVPEKTI